MAADALRARLRMIVKRILRMHGYPQKKATETVLQQAEASSNHCAAEAS
jgi:hypothetical protein